MPGRNCILLTQVLYFDKFAENIVHTLYCREKYCCTKSPDPALPIFSLWHLHLFDRQVLYTLIYNLESLQKGVDYDY